MSEELVVRSMPHSLEAEQSVIGALFIDNTAISEVIDIVSAYDFYHKMYRVIFETIVEMNNKGIYVDPITVYEELKKNDEVAENFNLEDLSRLIIAVPTSANVKQYAQIVKDKSILRNIIKLNEEIANICYDANKDTDEILNITEEKVFKLVQSKGKNVVKPIKELVGEVIEKVYEASKNPGSVTGIPTGFLDLDKCLSGLQPSDLILIAARPSMGKTAFVLNIAENVAVKQGITTAIFSLEMSGVQLVKRLMSMETGVSSEKLTTGKLSGSDWSSLTYGADVLVKSNMIIDDTPAISIPEMRSRCRKYKLEHNLGLVIIDYLQLMSGGTKKEESRQQEISTISRGLKALARELNVPILALSQLSRAPEQRQDHRPMLSDLRESGAIEQDADVVMLIYRDDYYNRDTEEKGISEINVAKQRNGPVRTIKLGWIPEQTRFVNLAFNNEEQ